MKGIIFDLDGVLVFTDRYHYLAWKQLADRIGAQFDETVNNRLRGVSRMESLEIVLEGYSGTLFTQEEKEALAAEKNETYRKLLAQMSPADVSDGVRVTLALLRARGYKLAIGSSSKNAKFILERTELTDAFDAISDGTNITNSKPDPEVFLKAAELIGVAPEDCAVVEDAEAGIQAAKTGGMIAIAIGPATALDLPDYKLTAFSDLLKLFE